MLKILIVEDDAQLASTLKYLIEDHPRYRVVAMAEDEAGAIEAAQHHRPDLALVDLRLARGSTGFAAAVRLNDFAIPCLFVSGRAPDFPMPDLALGCLMKPFTGDDVYRALATAEDMMRGRETVRPRAPKNLCLYDSPEELSGPEPLPPPPRWSLKRRLEQWILGAA